MAQLRRDHQQFVDRGIEVILIGPDSAASFAQYWAKESIPFRGLPDPETKVLTSLGQEVHLLRLGRMPAQILIDRAGVVRYLHYGASMRDIPPTTEVLAWFDRAMTGSPKPR
jgi:peroxiredoxin Q/BCP